MSGLRRPTFKLWAKVEPDEEEQHLIDTYQFNGAMVVEVDQPGLARKTVLAWIAAFLIAGAALYSVGMWDITAFIVPAAIATVFAFWWYNEHRETIYLKDLLHGRKFNCKSIIELAQKEAQLENIVSAIRQVLETAKQWDGTETRPIVVLPRDQARQFVLTL